MDRFQQRLFRWFSSSQTVDADASGGQIDVAADQTVAPSGVDVEAVSQKRDRSLIVRTANENHGAFQRPGEIQLPSLGEFPTRRSSFNATGRTLMAGGHVTVGPLRQVVQSGVREAAPNLGLPTSVVTFDRSLKAGLARRSEDDGHAQLQAQPGDATMGWDLSGVTGQVSVKRRHLRVSQKASRLLGKTLDWEYLHETKTRLNNGGVTWWRRCEKDNR